MRGPTTESSIRDLSADHLDSLIEALASFPRSVRQRGRDYAERGRVGPVVVRNDAIGALVRGTLTYESWWTWDDDLWLGSCTCPIGDACKHLYALACRA